MFSVAIGTMVFCIVAFSLWMPFAFRWRAKWTAVVLNAWLFCCLTALHFTFWEWAVLSGLVGYGLASVSETLCRIRRRRKQRESSASSANKEEGQRI